MLHEEQVWDPITGSKLTPTANCHHLDQRFEHYMNLNKDHFVMLNKKTHSMIHFLYNVYRKRGDNLFKEMKKIFDDMIKYSND